MEVDGNTTGYEIINFSTVQALENGLVIDFKVLFQIFIPMLSTFVYLYFSKTTFWLAGKNRENSEELRHKNVYLLVYGEAAPILNRHRA